MSTLRALAIVHQADAGPGVFSDAAGTRGWELETWEIAKGGSPADDPHGFDAVIVFGGAVNVHEAAEHPWMIEEKALLGSLIENDVPVLGVCLGAQLLADAIGAKVERASEPEIGWYDVELTPQGALDPLVGPLAPRFSAFEWHSYAFALPPGAEPLASTPTCLQAFRHGRSTWGIQFHAEVTSEIVQGWIDDFRSDGDAVRIGLDAQALAAETTGAIAGWNVVGRGICQRFLDVAVTLEPPMAPVA